MNHYFRFAVLFFVVLVVGCGKNGSNPLVSPVGDQQVAEKPVVKSNHPSALVIAEVDDNGVMIGEESGLMVAYSWDVSGRTSRYDFRGRLGQQIEMYSSGLSVNGMYRAIVFDPVTNDTLGVWHSLHINSGPHEYIFPIGGKAYKKGTRDPMVSPLRDSVLRIALASEQNANNAILTSGGVQGGNAQAFIPFVTYTFTVPAGSAPVSVTGLTYEKSGFAHDSNMNRLYLFVGESVTELIATQSGLRNGEVRFANGSVLFTVHPGESVSYTLRGDLHYRATGPTIGFTLIDVETNNNVNVFTGTEMAGPVYDVRAISDLGKVWFSRTASPLTNDTYLQVDDDIRVWQGDIHARNTNIELRSLSLSVVGVFTSQRIRNIRLMHNGEIIAQVDALDEQHQAVFNFVHNPQVLLKNKAWSYELCVDIADGFGGEDFYFGIMNPSDIVLYDSDHSVYITPYRDGFWELIRPYGDWLLDSAERIYRPYSEGILSVSLSSDSPVGGIPSGVTGVTVASYEYRAYDDDMQALNQKLKVLTTGTGLTNVRIMQTVGSSQVQVTDAFDIHADVPVVFPFTSTLVVQKGNVVQMHVVADIVQAQGSSFQKDETIQIVLEHGEKSAKRLQDGSITSSTFVHMREDGTVSYRNSTPVHAHAVSIQVPEIVVTRSSHFGDMSIVAGDTNVRVAAFDVEMMNVSLTEIQIRLSADEAGSITNLQLRETKTGRQVGATRALPSTQNIFRVSLSDTTTSFEVYADISQNIKEEMPWWSVNVFAVGYGVFTQERVPGESVDLQVLNIGGTGNVYLNNWNQPEGRTIIAGESLQMASFAFSSENIGHTISQLQLKTGNAFAHSVSQVSIQYRNRAGDMVTASQVFIPDPVSGFAKATFTGLSLYVPKDQTSGLYVTVETVLLSTSGRSGAHGRIYVDHAQGFNAVSDAGAVKTIVGRRDVSSNEFVIRKSIPTIERLPVHGPPTSSSGLYRFRMKADAAGNVELKQLAFAISSTNVSIRSLRLWDVAAALYLTDPSDIHPDQYGDVQVPVGGFLDDSGTPDNDAIVFGTHWKVYELRGTVTGWTDESQLQIWLLDDSTPQNDRRSDPFYDNDELYISSAPAIMPQENIVWSDRSTSNHSMHTPDWANGYLINTPDSPQRF